MQISAAGRISRRAKWTEIRHASAWVVGTSHTTGMLDSLILILFVISGAAAGWLGVDLLPEQQLIRIPNLEQLTWILAAVGAAVGLPQNAISQIEAAPDHSSLARVFKVLAALELEVVVRPRQPGKGAAW